MIIWWSCGVVLLLNWLLSSLLCTTHCWLVCGSIDNAVYWWCGDDVVSCGDNVVSCGGDWLVVYCVEMCWVDGFAALNVIMHLLVLLQPQCTHTAPLTSYCTSVPFSHCFCLLSPPGTDKPCCSGTQVGLLTWSMTVACSVIIILQVLKGRGLTLRPTPLFSGRGSDVDTHYYHCIIIIDSLYGRCRWVVSACMCAAMDTLYNKISMER